MSTNIILIDKLYQNDSKLIKNFITTNDTVICFDYDSHKILEQLGVQHEIADNYLDKNERMELFDHVITLYNWYEKNSIAKELEFENINLFNVMDSLELHLFLLPEMIKFFIIKKIILLKNFSKIICTPELYQFVNQFVVSGKIQLLPTKNMHIDHINDVEIRFNFMKKPITIYLSTSIFNKIKNYYESIVCTIFGLQHNKNNKKTILLLEFNPDTYRKLLSGLRKSDKNVVLLNRRRSAIWNIKSIRTLHESNCKVLDMKKIIDKKTERQIRELQLYYSNKLKKLWKQEELLCKIFSKDGNSFWPCIKYKIINMYHNRIPKYVKFLVESKTIFEKLMVSSILYQYESGETENSIILAKPSNIKSLLLRHGFSSYYKTTSNLRWRYDTERLLPRHPNTMLLWGKADFDYYSEHIKTTKQEFVITGCPKYDQFFNKNINIKNNDKKKILITPEPLTYGWSGLLDTNSAIKYEIFLNKLIKLLKKIKNVEILVKLHPGWGWTHNNTLITIFHNIDPTIPVYQTKPIQELLEIVDIVINLTPEDNEPSTVMLEALIFKIPVIDISLDDRNNNFEYEADKPMCTLSYKANIEKYINKILFDEIFQTNLIRCSQIILENYLANKGSSSLHVANLLCSL